MAGIDYNGIRQDIENQLGSNSLGGENQEQEELLPFVPEQRTYFNPTDPFNLNGKTIDPLKTASLYDEENPGLFVKRQLFEKEEEDKLKEKIKEEKEKGTKDEDIVKNIPTYQQEIREELLGPRDIETGEFLLKDLIEEIHNELVKEIFNEDIVEGLLKEYLNYRNLHDYFSNGLNYDVESAYKNEEKGTKSKELSKEERYFNSQKEELINDYIKTLNDAGITNEDGSPLSYAQGEEMWNSKDNPTLRSELLTRNLGKKVFANRPEKLLEFMNYSYEERQQMLASEFLANQYHRALGKELTFSQELKDRIEASKYDDTRLDIGIYSHDFESNKRQLELDINDLFERIKSPRIYTDITSRVSTPTIGVKAAAGVAQGLYSTGGGMVYLMMQLGRLVSSVPEAVTNYVAPLFSVDTNAAEITDELISSLADKQILRDAQKIKEEWLAQIKEKKLTEQELVDSWDEKSEQYSNIYLLNKGNHFVEEEGTERLVIDKKIDLLAKFKARVQSGGIIYAAGEVGNYYKNMAHDRMGITDYLGRTGGQFVSNGVAEIVSFAAVMRGLAKFAVPYGKDPYDEGFIDYLMHDELLQRAIALLETGCWDIEKQKKYKELGLNQYQIYRTAELENQFMSSADIPDLIGQYGFTAATTLLSFGGSWAIRGGASLTRGRIGGYLVAPLKKLATRGLAKLGLMSKESLMLTMTTGDYIAGAIARNQYWGNLLFTGLLGTAEGALEAGSSYRHFIEDNIPRYISLDAESIIESILGASKEQLDSYMLKKGYPAKFKLNKEKGEFLREYTDEQYAQAKQELIDATNERINNIKSKIEDDALDSAAANFIWNSWINGLLNVTMKQSLLSNDAREALNAFKGNKPLSSYIDIVEKDGKYVAVTKKNKTRRLGGHSWKDIRNNPKGAIQDLLRVGKGAVKTSWGEALEEYNQGISDAVSRAAFQSDLEDYMQVMTDPEITEAYATDYANLLASALDLFGTEVTNVENIKEGVFGFLSTLIGGISPGRYIPKLGTKLAEQYLKNKKEKPGFWKGALGYITAPLRAGTGLVDSAIFSSYNEQKEEILTAEWLTDSVNTWLLNSKAQELMLHLGGAIGFNKRTVEAMVSGDMFEAKNNQLALAIENIIMLESLKGTRLYDAYMQTIQQRTLLGENAQFDSAGNFIGSESDVLTEAIRSAISEFRNHEASASRSTTKTDLEVLEKIRKNATEFLELRDRVQKVGDRVRYLFKQPDIDNLTIGALTHAFIQEEEAKKRSTSIKGNLSLIIRSALDKGLYFGADGTPFSKLSDAIKMNVVQAIAEYGDIDTMRAAVKQMDVQIGELDDAGKNAGVQKMQVRQNKNRLVDAIAALEKLQETSGKEGALFSAKDLAMLDFDTLANIVQNAKRQGSKIGKANKDIVDAFLRVTSLEAKTPQEGQSILQIDDLIDEEQISDDFIDYLALLDKTIAYDKHIYSYIRNPEWLSNTAARLRRNSRSLSLQRIYSLVLQMKEGESIYDYYDRIGQKYDSLMEQGKVEDASILNELALKNPNYRGFATLRTSLLFIQSEYREKSKLTWTELELELLNQAVALLLTVAADTNTTGLESLLNKIKEFSRDINEALNTIVLDHLNRELAKNQCKDAVDKNNIDTLRSLLEIGNKMLMFHNNRAAENNAKTKESKINPEQEAPKQEPIKPAENPLPLKSEEPPTPPNQQGHPTGEKPVLSVITVGELADFTPEKEYLESNNGSDNLLQLEEDRKKGIYRSIHMRAINYNGLIVVAIGFIEPKNEGGRNIKVFKPFGVIPSNQSESSRLNIDLLAAKTRFSRTHTPYRDLAEVQAELQTEVQINKIGDVTPISDLHVEDAREIRELYDTEEKQVKFIDGLTTQTVTVSEGDNRKMLVSNGGYTVSFKTNGDGKYISVFDLEVGENQTLSSLLESLDINDNAQCKAVIDKLKQFKYFNLMFSAWATNLTNNAKNQSDANIKYFNLIKDFIHLGNIGTEDSDILIILEGDNLIIKVANKQPGSAFTAEKIVYNEIAKINLNAGSYEAREKELLRTLISIKNNIDKLSYSNPQTIGNLDRRASNFKEVLLGLILLGFVKGYARVSSKATILILNPYSDSSRASTLRPNVQRGQAATPEGDIVDPGTQQLVNNKELDTLKKDVVKRATTYLYNQMKAIRGLLDNIIQGIDKKGRRTIDRAATTRMKKFLRGFTYVRHSTGGGRNQSTALGNTVDDFVRIAFRVFNSLKAVESGRQILSNLNSLDKTKQEAAIKHFLSIVKSENLIPNFSEKQALYLVLNIARMFDYFDKKGWVVMSENIDFSGDLTIKKGDSIYGSIGTTSKLDLLVYEPPKNGLGKGKVHIIDVKTTRLTKEKEDEQTILNYNREEWRGQLYIYKHIVGQNLQDSTSAEDVEMGDTFIFPIYLYYEENNVQVAADGRTLVKKNSAFDLGGNQDLVRGIATRLQVSLGVIQCNTDSKLVMNEEDILYRIDVPSEEPIVDFDTFQKEAQSDNADPKLKEDFLKIKYNEPLSNDSAGNGPSGPQNPITPPPVIKPPVNPITSKTGPLQGLGAGRRGGKNKGSGRGNPVDIDFKDLSEHSEKESRFINFISTRISPIITYRGGTFSRLFSLIRRVTSPSAVREALTKDLADTFFNGDVVKCKSIVGTINISNSGTIVLNIKTYYLAYLERKERYKKSIQTRHNVGKALYLYLKNLITQQQFEEVLLENEADAFSIPEYIEYFNAEDRQAAANEIIGRIEKSDILDEELYAFRIQEFDKLMEDIESKMEFLDDPNAGVMISNRLQSVEKAIASEQIEYYTCSLNSTLKNILKGEETLFSAELVLQSMAKSGSSRYIRLIAFSVLNMYRKNNMGVILNVVRYDYDSNIEGSFENSVVNIYPPGLASEETLERVILHEMIHAISKDNIEVKEQLKPLLDEVIELIKKETGQTEEQIKNNTYGLKNVDEFISEFFTNMAFLESLKQLQHREDKYKTIFDRVIEKLKEIFLGKKDLYSKINNTMYQIFSTSNTFLQTRDESALNKSLSKYVFENLSEAALNYLKHLGIEKEEFDSMSRAEKDIILDCC